MTSDAALSPTKRALLEVLRARALAEAAAGPDAPASDAPAVLSAAQQRMWVIEQTEPDAAAYNTVRAVDLRGALDVPALRAAFTRVVDRHEALRTIVLSDGGRPVARVLTDPQAEFEVVDAPDADAGEALIDALGARAFDLGHEVPVRALLVRVSADQHLLGIVLHHIASDEGSRNILWRDLAAAYARELGDTVAAAPPALPYREFARWQHEALARVRDAELRFWGERLAGAPQRLTLPPDRVRGRRQSFRGARRRIALPDELVTGMRTVAREQRATVFMTALAAYLWLVRQWTGETDVVVGMPVTARGDGRFDDTIGLFVNTVVLRTDCSGAPTFRELVDRVRTTVVEALEHRDLPFDDVVDALAADRDQAWNPLVQILVNGTTVEQDGLAALPGLDATVLDLDPGTSKFDTGVLFAENDGGFEVVLGYASEIYRPETIEVLFDQLQAVLRTALAAPDAPLTGQALWSPAQRAFLDDVNDTATELERGTIHGAIEAQARATPDRPAVGDSRTGWLTYRELDEHANRLAHRLRAVGAGPGTRVAMCVPRSVQMQIALLGVLKAGAAYVPIDSQWPTARLAFLLADSGATVLLTDAATVALLPEHPVVVLVDDDTLTGEPSDPPTGLVAETDPAYLIYTSGSTGTPKGVLVAHAGVVNRLRWGQTAYPLDASDVLLQKTPLTFDVSGWEVYWPLMVGARIFLADPGGHRDPRYIADTIAEQGITLTHFVPSMLEVFLSAVESIAPQLRMVFVSGEALAEVTRDAFFARGGTRLINLYGPTEASIEVTGAEQFADPSAPVTIGGPIANMTVHVVDADGLPVPVGVTGELCLEGVGLAFGYLGRPELTAERFVTAAWDSGLRIYRTGDRARWTTSGEIDYLGRLDDQIKIRGLRIELGEIEAAIADHPLVAHSAVKVVTDANQQQGLVGYAVPAAAPTVEDADAVGPDLAESVSEWNAVWDRTYADAEPAAEPAAEDVDADPAGEGDDDGPDYRGWVSSYDGRPIPAEQMAGWVDETVERIRALRPRRIAEIGCGSGLLLERLAGECETYVGLDFSAATVERVARRCAALGWEHVELRVAAGHETAEALAQDEPFDVVVVNSVVQYFPDAAYLERTLDAAGRVVTRPGWIFVGDVRNLRTQRLFALDIARTRLGPDTQLGVVAAAASADIRQQTELLVDPSWFDAYAAGRDVSSVDVLVETSAEAREMTCFRYDAVLGFGPGHEPDAVDTGVAAPTATDTTDVGSVLAALASGARCAGLPDARVRVAAALAASDEQRRTVRSITSTAPAGIDPVELVTAAAAAGLALELSVAGPGRFDAAIRPAGRPVLGRRPARELPAGELTNAPREAAAARERAIRLAEELATSLRRRLPEYMVPGAFVVLDELPLSTNGKLDRARLPAPPRPVIDSTGHRKPAGPDEELVAAAFAEILGVTAVPVDVDFFTLGGHSLLAARLAALLERRTGLRIRLRIVFEAPTVAELAVRVAELRNESSRPSADASRPPDALAGADDRVVLSPAQERMVFLGELTGSSTLYGLRRVMRLRAVLDTDVLAAALRELAARHRSLRTMVAGSPDGPVAVVLAEPDLPLRAVDLRAEPDPLAAALALVDAAQDDGFDLEHGPLARLHALRLGDADWVLLLHVHHVAVDALSLDLLTDDLAALYEAHGGGRPAAAWDAAPYGDFAREQRAGVGVESQLAYWREQLAGRPDALDLPTDRPRPPVVTHTGDRIGLTVDAGVTAAIDALARRCASTRFTVLFAALSVVLSRLSGQSDVLVGTPTSGRTRPEYESTVGLFVNTVVLRARPDDAADFESLVVAAKRTVVDALRHQDVPFERVVEDLAPTRDTSRNPLFQVLLNLVPGRPGERQLAGAPLESLDVGTRSSRFDLSVTIAERDAGLFVALEYSTDLFDAATVERIGARLAAVLSAATADPRAPLRDLDVVLPAERAALDRWTSGPAREVGAGGVPTLVRDVAARQPDDVAVTGPDGSLTYAQLLARAARLARSLRAAGVTPGALVGIAVSRGTGLLVAQLGIWASGAAYVPLDLSFPADRLRFMVEDAGLGLVVVDGDVPGVLSGLVAGVALPSDEPGHGEAQDVPTPSDDDAAYVIYTSGSTGRPKGVVVPHGALRNLLETMAERPGFAAGESLLAVTTISFDIAGLELLLPLVRGGTVLVAEAASAADPYRLAALLADLRPDVMQATPSTWRMLVESGWRGAPGLRALCGGEAIGAELVRALRPLVGSLWNCYGPTETTIWSTVDELGDGPVTIGRPIANTDIVIRDEQQRPVPPGVVGELLIGGAGLALGYWQRPELTAERFVHDHDGVRLYRTGDLARWRPDGRIDLLGRVDHQVKIRGHRIELGEIESVLEQVDGVAEAVAVVEQRTDGDHRLLAYVEAPTLAGSPDGTKELLTRRLRERLPAYMHPSALTVLERLPRTANNKIDRGALPRPSTQSSTGYTAPAGELEELIASQWAELLGVATVSRDDDFFALGGHSILAGRMIARVSEATGRRVPLRSVFEFPTVRELAAHASGAVADPPTAPDRRHGHRVSRGSLNDIHAVESAVAGTAPAPVPGADTVEVFALSPAQKRMWMLHALDPDSGTYHVPVLRRVDGPLDVQALETAVDGLVARHEILRTTYRQFGALLVQVVEPPRPIPLRVIPVGPQHDGIAALARSEAARPFDLVGGPAVRAALLRVTSDEQYLLVVAHHIALDGGSIPVLLDDLAALYSQALDAHPDRSPATGPGSPALQYVDVRGALDDESADVDFWTRELSGAPTVTQLPVDRVSSVTTSSAGARVQRRLDPRHSAALRSVARTERTTPFLAVVAAWGALLFRHGAGADVVVGTPTSGRDFDGADRVVGPLINTVPLRLRVRGDGTFRQLVRMTADTAAAAFAHDRLPFESIRELVDSPQGQAHLPLFQVLVASRPNTSGGADLGSARLSRVAMEWGSALYDLSLTVDTAGDDIDLAVEYRSELFDESTIEALLDRLDVLLAAVADEPSATADTALARLPVLDARDTELLRGFNDSPVPATSPLLPELIRSLAEHEGELVAVRSGEDELTYAQLVRAADVLTGRLRAAGIRPGDIVGLSVGHRTDWVVGVLGVWGAGAAFLALDPDHPVARSQAAIDECGAFVVITSEHQLPRPNYENVALCALDVPALLEGEPAAVEPLEGDTLAYVMYTSGSSGRPKGSMIEHGSLASFAHALQDALSDGRRRQVYAINSPLIFDVSMQGLTRLGFGNTVDLIPDDIRRDPRELVAYLGAHGVDVLDVTPTHLRMLIQEGLLTRPGPWLLLVAGEAIEPDLWAALRASERTCFNCYGPTEVTVYSTLGTLADSAQPNLGRPTPGVQVHVVDAQGQPVPVGVPGELWLGGRQVSRGYLGRPELTAQRFLRDPWGHPTGRLYRTGDRVRLTRSGRLEFLGRLDDQVKVRGHRIELGEVEAAFRSLDGVAQAACVVSTVHNEKDLVVHVVPDDPQAVLDLAALRSGVRDTLPASMRPRWIRQTDRLPTLSSGKLDRAALAAVDVGALSAPDPVTLSEDPVHNLVSDVWQEVLGVQDIALDDDFFDSGGNSLLAIAVLSRLRELDIDVPTTVMFDAPTVRRVADAVADELLGTARG